uniref:Uncharacterized protein n=1 Tax=Amphimedon queenslandica TaxID=400682 RepID=A0A1X7T8I8_AMPQE
MIAIPIHPALHLVSSLRSQDFLELEQSRSGKRSLEEVLEEDDDEDFDLESWLSSSASADVPDSVMNFLRPGGIAPRSSYN